LMLVVFGLIFYFMILRPQQKRTKENKKLMDSIAKGDEVLTNGGLVGRVTKVAENGYIAIALNDTTDLAVIFSYCNVFWTWISVCSLAATPRAP
ncbi:preprotein translocase subunit YajC, partial [Escherichia coli]|uniref:preprotein translocase subunit YajC n=1 Tax=Escherichia coli TaxID=562 RepID=UPI00202303DF